MADSTTKRGSSARDERREQLAETMRVFLREEFGRELRPDEQRRVWETVDQFIPRAPEQEGDA